MKAQERNNKVKISVRRNKINHLSSEKGEDGDDEEIEEEEGDEDEDDEGEGEEEEKEKMVGKRNKELR